MEVEDNSQEEVKEVEEEEEDVFKLGVVNSYGSQEVQKLEHGVRYNFSSK